MHPLTTLPQTTAQSAIKTLGSFDVLAECPRLLLVCHFVPSSSRLHPGQFHHPPPNMVLVGTKQDAGKAEVCVSCTVAANQWQNKKNDNGRI